MDFPLPLAIGRARDASPSKPVSTLGLDPTGFEPSGFNCNSIMACLRVAHFGASLAVVPAAESDRETLIANAGRSPVKSPMQSTMRAVTFCKPGGPDVLEVSDCPLPQPAPKQVLARVTAAGVNGPDLLQRQGNYPRPKALRSFWASRFREPWLLSGKMLPVGASATGYVP